MKPGEILDIVLGILIIILAIKYFPVIGIFATIAFSTAGLKVAFDQFLRD